MPNNRDFGNMVDKPNILKNATDGVGNPLLDSGKKFPLPSNILIPKAPAS